MVDIDFKYTKLNYSELKRKLRLISALKAPPTQAILKIFTQNPNKIHTVTQLQILAGKYSQSQVSHALATFRHLNIVNCERDGQFRKYSLNLNKYLTLLNTINVLKNLHDESEKN